MADTSLSPQRARTLAAGALLAALAVAAGAFGAHALRGVLDARALGQWETATAYLLPHAVALVALGAMPLPRLGLPAALLGGGALLFAGTLYAMALTGWTWLGAVTPLGGTAMIAGWLLVAVRALQAQASR